MSINGAVDLRSFKQKVRYKKTSFRRFLNTLVKRSPQKIKALIHSAEQDVWKEVNCLSCANCCKTMTPTYTATDIKRIAAHFKISTDEFKKKWLRKERGPNGDWINKSTPCQFLDKKTNYCSIYAIRPKDCSGYPHLRKNLKDYIHVHRQNIECCPAAYTMVEKMKEKVESLELRVQSRILPLTTYK